MADNGIGMSRQEVIEHIGTIAKSGTREFLAALTGDQRQDASLIGQFGVGFYSAFIVADRVTLTTRRSGLTAAEGVRWESDGRGSYTLEAVEQPDRGTTVVLHLRADEDDLLSDYRLRSIIKKYSDHISLPIVMPAEPAEGDEGPPEEAPVNQASALWARPKSELSEQDYKDFYQHVTGDFSEPLAWVHSKIEGTYEYTLLLFIPSRAPFDLWIPQAGRGIKLHIRRVFVLEDSGQLMPQYLRFVRGVIDSADLPLNVSRELLQGSRVVDTIRSNAPKKVLRLLADIAEKEPEKYAAFWKEFGAVLKEGLPEDFGNRDEIAKLLRFTSTASASDEPDVSLTDYVGRMKEGQQHIYYLLAPGLAAAKASPHLEAFRKKGIEVLLFGDGEGIDNWVVASLREFDGKRLQDRGHLRVHAAAVHPVPGPLRPVDSSGRPGYQAAHQAGLRARGLRPADAAVPTVRPRRDRLRRPAAERLPRAAAGQPRGGQHPVQRDQEGAATARRHRGEGAGEVRRVLEGVRRRSQGGPARGLRQPGRDRPAVALHLD